MELAYYPWFVLGHLVAARFNICNTMMSEPMFAFNQMHGFICPVRPSIVFTELVHFSSLNLCFCLNSWTGWSAFGLYNWFISPVRPSACGWIGSFLRTDPCSAFGLYNWTGSFLLSDPALVVLNWFISVRPMQCLQFAQLVHFSCPTQRLWLNWLISVRPMQYLRFVQLVHFACPTQRLWLNWFISVRPMQCLRLVISFISPVRPSACGCWIGSFFHPVCPSVCICSFVHFF
jgi:hypothetical protein